MGLVLFGFLSLLMDVFKIVNYVGYLHCDSAVKVAFPVVQAVFLFLQVITVMQLKKTRPTLMAPLTIYKRSNNNN